MPGGATKSESYLSDREAGIQFFQPVYCQMMKCLSRLLGFPSLQDSKEKTSKMSYAFLKMDRRILKNNTMVPFVDFTLEIPTIIMLEDPENRSEGEKFLLTYMYERVKGIQSAQPTGATKKC